MPRRQSNYRWKEEVIRTKREAAEKRAEAYSKRSVKEQLELIEERRKRGLGNSAKEKAKLEAKLNG